MITSDQIKLMRNNLDVMELLEIVPKNATSNLGTVLESLKEQWQESKKLPLDLTKHVSQELTSAIEKIEQWTWVCNFCEKLQWPHTYCTYCHPIPAASETTQMPLRDGIRRLFRGDDPA